MKRMFLILILCSAAAGLTGCAGGIEMFNFGHKASDDEAGKKGRFQVVAVPGAAQGELGTAIKIDTATGETWSAQLTPFYPPQPPEWRKFKN